MSPSVERNVIRMPKQRAKQVRSRISYLSNEQLERFLAGCEGIRRTRVRHVSFCGCTRCAEHRNRQPPADGYQLQNRADSHCPPEGLAGLHAELVESEGQRPFNEAAALKAWLDLREPDADNFVFNSQKSTRLNRVTVYKLFKAIAKKAGLGETLQHPHVLKHTAAMLMVQQGANAFIIRQHLGHRSFDSTLAYVNPSDADASAASAKAFAQVF